MSRICDSTSAPRDYCLKCLPDEDDAFEEMGNLGDGPDGRGNCFEYEPEHPPYEDDEHYHCYKCHARLAERDN